MEELTDLPRRADFKVALNLLDQRGAPSFEEGICKPPSIDYFQGSL